MTPSVLFLTSEFQQSAELKKAIDIYQANGADVFVQDYEGLRQCLFNTFNIIIVDLDSCDVKDTEEFKELLSEKATRILVVCTTSFQRLLYYKDFEVFTSYGNLIEREFFAH